MPDQSLNRNVDRFVEFLSEKGLVEDIALRRAISAHKASGQSLETVLLDLGILEEAQLAEALASHLGLRQARAADWPHELEPSLDSHRDFIVRSQFLPISVTDNLLTLATATPLHDVPARSLAYYLGLKLELIIATRGEISSQLESLLADPVPTNGNLGSDVSIVGDVERLKDLASEAPIVRLFNRLVSTAVDRRASDIHLEQLEDRLRVRYRIDGGLQIAEILEGKLHLALVSRIKILARLNIAENRLPQDGRINMVVKGREIDLRVATTPTFHGENVVVRILDRKSLASDFQQLGFSTSAINELTQIMNTPNGIVLVTGPTGSGKTTTLYAALSRLNRVESKIFTAEDPIEYHIKGINQVLVRPQIGLDFANILRSVLRQDPDIIMVGEIRDRETAQIAVQAALTGHLVLSTVHTNSAVATIARLRNLGIEDFLLASSLRAIVSQRLVRKICDTCAGQAAKQPCKQCNNTGYSGRTVIYEILDVSGELKNAIAMGAPEAEIEKLALEGGMVLMQELGKQKVKSGETSREEVIRATGTV